MKNQEAVFPSGLDTTDNYGPKSFRFMGGMTKLELFAGMALQGILAKYWNANADGTPEIFAENAVKCAKALIKEIDKKTD